MRYLVAALFAITFSLHSLAAELTDQSLQKWVQSYSAIIAWSKTQDQKALEFLEQDQKKNPEFDQLFSTALKQMKGHKIYGDFTGVLKKNGFSDPNEWANVGDRVMAATLALELEKQQTNAPQARAQLKQAMDAMMNNPNITAEQKAQMQQMMGMGNQMLDVADKVPAADKEAVKRNAALIQTVMTQNDNQD